MAKDVEKTSRTRMVAVDNQVQALVLKKALNDFVSNIEQNSSDGLLSKEDIIQAAEDLLDRTEALAYFQPVTRATRSAKAAGTAKTKTVKAPEAAV